MKSKLFLTLALIAFSNLTRAKSLGCYPIEQYLISAKIYDSNGVERVDQTCFKTHIMWVVWDDHLYNEHSNESEWVLYLRPGDTFKLDCKSASESSSAPDFGLHSIKVESGELFGIEEYNYQANGGSCYEQGSGIRATLADSATLIVQNPYNASPSGRLTIHIKRLPPQTETLVETPYVNPMISQIAGTNQVLYVSGSEKEELLEVYTSSGSIVKRMEVLDHQTIDLQELPMGVYILRSPLDGNDLIGRFRRW